MLAAEHDEEDRADGPIMPHMLYSPQELDRLYPAMEAPGDEDELKDLCRDEEDVVYQHGVRIAQEIQEETVVQGRRRRPLPQHEHDDHNNDDDNDNNKHDNDNDHNNGSVLQLELLGWITNSASDPRRRAKSCQLPHYQPPLHDNNRPLHDNNSCSLRTSFDYSCGPRALRARALLGLSAGTWLAQEQVP